MSVYEKIEGILRGAWRTLDKLFSKNRIANLVFVLSCFVLVSVSVYSAAQSSRVEYTNADQYIGTYATADTSGVNQLALSSDHINLLKLPILWLQGTLPYSFASFVIVNIILFVLCIFGWALIVRRISNSRLAAAFNFIMAGILLSSPDLSVNLTMPTIRNIEFPLSFIAVLLFVKIAQKTARGIHKFLAIAIFSLLIVSDGLFVYTLYLSLLLGAGLLYLRNKKAREAGRLFWWPTLAVILAKVIQIILSVSGAVVLSKSIYPVFTPFQNIGSAIGEVIREIFLLFGGNIFGQAARMQNVGLLFFFLLTLTFCVLFVRFLKKEVASEQPNMTWIILSFFVLLTIAAYIFSNNVAMSDYMTLAYVNIRYITIVALVVPLLALVWLAKHYRTNSILLISFTVFGFGLLAAIPNRTVYTKQTERLYEDRHKHFLSISQKLQEESVPIALGTFTYSSSITFFSKESVRSYPVINCNEPVGAVTNIKWYEPSKSINRSALIIDQTPRGREGWENCPPERLEEIYGKPSKVVDASVRAGKPIKLMIYDYDIRVRLKTHQELYNN